MGVWSSGGWGFTPSPLPPMDVAEPSKMGAWMGSWYVLDQSQYGCAPVYPHSSRSFFS